MLQTNFDVDSTEENSASDRKTTSAFSAEAIRKIGFNPDASAGQLNGSEKDEKVNL